MSLLIGDTESDSFKFESTLIWVACFYNTEEDYYTFSFDNSVYEQYNVAELIEREIGVGFREYYSHEEHLQHLQDHAVCTHNWFQHDKPLIKKFYPDFQPKEEHDSYILSQLFNPDRGLHGLDAWGQRFGHPKPKHEEWDKFSPEMLHRVIEDVKINVKVWEALMKEKKEWEDLGGSWDEAIKIEYGIADLQGRQEMHGVLLDVDKAYDLADEIYREIQKIDEKLLAEMPLRTIMGSEVKAPFKKDGNVTKAVERWFE